MFALKKSNLKNRVNSLSLIILLSGHIWKILQVVKEMKVSTLNALIEIKSIPKTIVLTPLLWKKLNLRIIEERK